MKKVILGLLAVAFAANVKAQAVEKGNVIIDAYAGYSFMGSVFKAYENESQLNAKSSTFIPVGLRGEFMITNVFSIGLDAYYTANKLEYQQEGYDYVNNANVLYDYTLQRKKIATYLTFNFHVLQNADKADLSLTVGTGYRNVTWTETSTDPDYVPTEIKNLIPISFRMGATFRYFFTDNIGAHVSASIGGPTLSGGLSLKF